MLIFPLNRNVCPTWSDEIKKKGLINLRDPRKLKQEAFYREKGSRGECYQYQSAVSTIILKAAILVVK